MKKDKITDREYHYLTSNDQLDEIIKGGLINSSQVLIGSFNNQSRFLLNDGTLAIVTHHQPVELYNILSNSSAGDTGLLNNTMTFYLGEGHAQIGFNCSQCDQGTAHNKFYDLNSKVGKSDVPFFPYPGWQKSYISFDLSNDQANAVFTAISDIYDASEKGEYKYIELIHNCVALLTDVYKSSGLPHHFSQYFKDDELLNQADSDTTMTAYTHRFYYVSNHTDPSRAGIKEFVKSIFGSNYTESWDYNKHKIEGLDYCGIRCKNIDFEEAQNWPVVLNRINEVKEIRKTVYPELLNISYSLHNQENRSFTISDLEALTYYLINKNITYENLYYTYVLKHELEIARLFQNKPEGAYIIDTIEESVQGYCWGLIQEASNDDSLSHLCTCEAYFSPSPIDSTLLPISSSGEVQSHTEP